MSWRIVVKSPTPVTPVPTLVLAPAVESRTWSLSGKGLAAVVRVQNLMTSPLLNVRLGVSSQLLIVLAPVELLKFAPIYAPAAPACAGKTAEFPWNQPVVPTGVLLFCVNQPEAGRVVISAKPSVIACARALLTPRTTQRPRIMNEVAAFMRNNRR